MDITLRRAAALQVTIREAVDRLQVNPAIEVSIFAGAIEPLLTKGRAKFDETISARDSLLNVLYDLRKKVGKANVSSGISDILADQARNNQDIAFLGKLSNARPAEDIAITRKRAERAANRDDSQSRGYGMSVAQDTISTDIMDEADIARFSDMLRDAERRKTDLSDRLSELNASTKIELDPDHIEILKSAKLI